MKQLLGLLLIAAIVALYGPALAADAVLNTLHNLSSTRGGSTGDIYTTSTDEVCVFCHTPHGGTNTGAPLWNRAASSATYTMYNSTYSSTIDMTVAAQPQGVSAACLSCHDGTLAFDALRNLPGSGGYNPAAPSAGYTWNLGVSQMPAGEIVNIGTDLTNDHPISITYDITKDTAFNSAVSGKVGTLPLYGASKNQVECGSCHNPHDATYGTFLRVSNAGSALCTTCHIK